MPGAGPTPSSRSTGDPEAPLRRVGAIPWLRENGTLRFVLVTNKDHDRWVLPKGRLERHLGKKALAALEAWEEAGIRGTFLGGDPIDVVLRRRAGRIDLRLYPLRVDRLTQRWPERRRRARRVVSTNTALSLLSDPGMRDAVAQFAAQAG